MTYRTAILLAMTALPASLTFAQDPPAKPAVQNEPVVIEVDITEQGIAAVNNQIVIVATPAVDGPLKVQVAEDAQDADAPQEKSDNSDNEKPDKEDLAKKMRELELQLQQARDKFQQQANEQRIKAQKDAHKAIDDINLPENPTRKQCEEFVAKLRKATEGRRSYSSSDPASIKLKEIPAEHFDLLIAEMTDRTSPLRYYANYAMREIEPEKLRERFVKSIDDNPNNIGVIVMHGWCEDVRPAIINYMQSADSSISPAWFQAAVEIDEPSLYPKLHEITTQSRYASQFIAMLEMLPDYDLAHTLDVCWKQSREGKLSVSYTTFAPKAVSYGNIEALGAMIDQLRSSSSYMSHSSTYNMRRTQVLRHIDYRGSNSEIQEWYKANKDKLVFDQLRQRFIIPEEF